MSIFILTRCYDFSRPYLALFEVSNTLYSLYMRLHMAIQAKHLR